MKQSLIFLLLVLMLPAVPAIAQPALPSFLEGTWKMENREIYEQWEMLDDGSLKGTSYRLNNGKKAVTEYLEIRRQENAIIYTATVLNQNEGKGIDFILQQPDSLTWSFENPVHDFPKKIVYRKRSDTEIYVQVSDGGEKGFAYINNQVSVQSNPNSSLIVTTDRYEFYSNFWINMHHFLYKKGEESEDRPWREVFDSRTMNSMSRNELEILGNAVEHYKENLIDKNLLFNDQMYWTKRALIKFEAGDELDHEVVEAVHQQLLNDTKGVYKKYFWEVHDRQNRKIVRDHIALFRKIETPAFNRIAELAQQPWPDEKVRVDVSYYSNWAGAYCTVTPIHAVVTSQYEGPEGTWPEYAWLELLFHEPSHALMLPNESEVGKMIAKVSKELDVEIPGNLWHAILFYFSGSVVQEFLKEEGIEYELLMVTNDIFSRYHSTVFESLPAYMQGEESLEKALTKAVQNLND